jgi:hypothetical protein
MAIFLLPLSLCYSRSISENFVKHIFLWFMVHRPWFLVAATPRYGFLSQTKKAVGCPCGFKMKKPWGPFQVTHGLSSLGGAYGCPFLEQK